MRCPGAASETLHIPDNNGDRSGGLGARRRRGMGMEDKEKEDENKDWEEDGGKYSFRLRQQAALHQLTLTRVEVRTWRVPGRHTHSCGASQPA